MNKAKASVVILVVIVATSLCYVFFCNYTKASYHEVTQETKYLICHLSNGLASVNETITQNDVYPYHPSLSQVKILNSTSIYSNNDVAKIIQYLFDNGYMWSYEEGTYTFQSTIEIPEDHNVIGQSNVIFLVENFTGNSLFSGNFGAQINLRINKGSFTIPLFEIKEIPQISTLHNAYVGTGLKSITNSNYCFTDSWGQSINRGNIYLESDGDWQMIYENVTYIVWNDMSIQIIS